MQHACADCGHSFAPLADDEHHCPPCGRIRALETRLAAAEARLALVAENVEREHLSWTAAVSRLNDRMKRLSEAPSLPPASDALLRRIVKKYDDVGNPVETWREIVADVRAYLARAAASPMPAGGDLLAGAGTVPVNDGGLRGREEVGT